MKIENQVCSLEQARKLKELGVAQIGYLTYCHSGVCERMADAFTVAELGAMFGSGTRESENLYNAVLSKLNSGNPFNIVFRASFLADYLIWALENKYITAADCNERLKSA